MRQENSKKHALAFGIIVSGLLVSACATTAPPNAAPATAGSAGDVIEVNSEGETAEMTKEQYAAAIESNRKVRDCRKRQRSTGSRIAREACGNVTSIFGTGIHVNNENNVSVGAGSAPPVP